jgi:hypothetical protein
MFSVTIYLIIGEVTSLITKENKNDEKEKFIKEIGNL